MSVKNAVGTSLIVIGLLLALVGWNKRGGETVTKDIRDTEVVVRNIDNYNLNWRAFFGLTFAGLGLGLVAFPSNKKIEEGRFD